MNDLVGRLRLAGDGIRFLANGDGGHTIAEEAADEIERLLAEVERHKSNENIQMERAIKAERALRLSE